MGYLIKRQNNYIHFLHAQNFCFVLFELEIVKTNTRRKFQSTRTFLILFFGNIQ